MSRALSTTLRFLAAVAVAVILGTIVQTQVNLGFLQSLGVEIPLDARLRTTWQDLGGFTPFYTLVVILALLPALVIASLLVRLRPGWHTGLYTVAAAVGLLTAVLAMNALLSMPVIAATRVPQGTLGMALAAAAGGWIFARLNPPSRFEGYSPDDRA